MELKKLLTEAIFIESALYHIQNNNAQSYMWFPVIGKNGCFFELGGRNTKDFGIELSAYIPRVENGKYVNYGNGFVRSEYRIDMLFIDFPDRRVRLPEDFDFLSFIKNTDFKTYFPEVEDVETIEM